MRAARIRPAVVRRPGGACRALLLGLILLSASVHAGDMPMPDIAAHAFVLMDARTGTELASSNADEHLPPASLTKLMTAYLLFGDLRAGRLQLDDPVKISARAAHQPGARMFLREGETVPVGELFKGMLVQSGNDAAYALAEHVSPDIHDFVARMNAKAAELGLDNTHFGNVTGLNHTDHYSSARDLTHLAAALRRDFPEYLGWFALRRYTWDGITQPNRNLLLGHVEGVDGLKTGHTNAAGYCLVASAERGDMQLIATILGTDSEHERAVAGRALLEYGFREFETRLVYRAVTPLMSLPIWEGQSESVALGPGYDLWLTLPRGAFARLQSHAALPQAQLAPVTHGKALGQLDVNLDGQKIAEVPLVALDDVAEGGLAKRAADRFKLWLRHEGVAQATP
jgi:D-alanyl-D-alanine carboxypeptidase (penicillin-binding protein 5/6)